MNNNLSENNTISYYVRSDIEFINTQMNKINCIINKSANENTIKHSFISNTEKNNLYNTMNSIANKYFEAEKIILEKLKNEIQVNLKIGTNYIELDDKLENEESNL